MHKYDLTKNNAVGFYERLKIYPQSRLVLKTNGKTGRVGQYPYFEKDRIRETAMLMNKVAKDTNFAASVAYIINIKAKGCT